MEPVESVTSTTPQTPTPLVARSLSFTSPGSGPGSPGSGSAGSMPDGSFAQGVSLYAVKKRIARLMTPKADGKLKVPQEMVDEWNKGDQDKLAAEFSQAGLDKDFSTFSILFVL